jgi:hypothetical protein
LHSAQHDAEERIDEEHGGEEALEVGAVAGLEAIEMPAVEEDERVRVEAFEAYLAVMPAWGTEFGWECGKGSYEFDEGFESDAWK